MQIYATTQGRDLGGVGVGNQRWTGRFKQELRDSRITPTEVIAEAARTAGVPTFISASASGYYGDTGEHAATESDGPGAGFLADLVVDWENAATQNAGDRTRVVLLRTAPVLSPSGGLLAKLRPIFKLGLGGTIGSGRQYFSWITLVDEVRAIEFLLSSTISGPINLAAPGSVPFADFVSAFGRAVHRPTIARVPGFAAKFVGGEFFRPDLSRLVVDADGAIAAFCLVSVNEDDWATLGASHAYIDLIGVVREHRRRGLAPLVISGALQAIADAGLAKAVLDVDTASPTGANTLYERLGFVATERSVALVKKI